MTIASPWASEITQYVTMGLMSLGGLGVLGYSVFRSIVRRVSKDGLETTKDRAEGGFVDHLLAQNKALTEANNLLRAECVKLSLERAEVLSKIGKYESDNDHLKQSLETAQLDIALLRRQLGVTMDRT